MGISNIASNLRPGICTSSTRPTTPYEGQVIYETDTNRVLVYDNTAWVDPSTGQTGKSGLVRVTPTGVSGTGTSIASNGDVVVSSGGQTFTVNGVFSANYKNYKIIVSDLKASGASGLFLSMGTSSTGTSHKWATVSVNSSGTVAGSGSGGSSYFDCPIVTRGTTDSAGGEITLFSPFEATETSITCSGGDSDNSALMRQMSGRLINDTSYTDCFFDLSSTFTFTSVTLAFYGYN